MFSTIDPHSCSSKTFVFWGNVPPVPPGAATTAAL